jgi:hypothetical protein
VREAVSSTCRRYARVFGFDIRICPAIRIGAVDILRRIRRGGRLSGASIRFENRRMPGAIGHDNQYGHTLSQRPLHGIEDAPRNQDYRERARTPLSAHAERILRNPIKPTPSRRPIPSKRRARGSCSRFNRLLPLLPCQTVTKRQRLFSIR